MPILTVPSAPPLLSDASLVAAASSPPSSSPLEQPARLSVAAAARASTSRPRRMVCPLVVCVRCRSVRVGFSGASVGEDLRQEVACAVAARRREERLGVRLLDDLSAVHEDDAVRGPAGEAHLVGD